MPSPFPGMDPFIESQNFWPDFHLRFITCWAEAIAERLPDNYDARLDERVYVVELPEEEARLIRPDVTIVEREPSARRWSSSDGPVATLEPVVLPHCVIEEVSEPFLRILHRADQTVVAILELLSPNNKSGSGRGVYLEKRGAILAQSVHLVELDLLLGGTRLPMRLPLPAGDYFAFVSRREHRPDCEVYHWSLRDPLPKIPIPLQSPNEDLIIDLSEVFALTYERGRFARGCDYSQPIQGSVNPADREWITARVQGTD